MTKTAIPLDAEEQDALAETLRYTETTQTSFEHSMGYHEATAAALLAAGYRKESVVRADQIAKDARIAGEYTWNPDAHPNHGVVIARTIRAQLGDLGATA